METSNYDEVLGYTIDGVDEDDLRLGALEAQWEFDEFQEDVLHDIHDGIYLSPDGY